MPFFMIINGKINIHEFDYLDNITGRRLDSTLAPGRKKHIRADDSVDAWAAELMSKDVITLTPKNKVSDAIKIFRKEGVHHIPLEKDGILVGLVSDRDIMWLNLLEIDNNATLEQFMSRIVIVCHEDTPVDYLSHVFYREQINSMPVIGEEDRLVGIVTSHDILRWVYDK